MLSDARREQLSIAWKNCDNNQHKIHKNWVLVGADVQFIYCTNVWANWDWWTRDRAIWITAINPTNQKLTEINSAKNTTASVKATTDKPQFQPKRTGAKATNILIIFIRNWIWQENPITCCFGALWTNLWSASFFNSVLGRKLRVPATKQENFCVS